MSLRDAVARALPIEKINEAVQAATGRDPCDVMFPAFSVVSPTRMDDIYGGLIPKLVLQFTGQMIPETRQVAQVLQEFGACIPGGQTRRDIDYPELNGRETPVYLGAAAALWHENKLLTMRRDANAPAAPDMFWLPAGVVDGGGPIDRHALVELCEEVGLVGCKEGRYFLILPTIAGVPGVSVEEKRAQIHLINERISHNGGSIRLEDDAPIEQIELQRVEGIPTSSVTILDHRGEVAEELSNVQALFHAQKGPDGKIFGGKRDGFDVIRSSGLVLPPRHDLLALFDTEVIPGLLNGRRLYLESPESLRRTYGSYLYAPLDLYLRNLGNGSRIRASHRPGPAGGAGQRHPGP